MRDLRRPGRRTAVVVEGKRPTTVYPGLGSPGTLRDRSLRSTAFEPFSERQLRLFGSRQRRSTA